MDETTLHETFHEISNGTLKLDETVRYIATMSTKMPQIQDAKETDIFYVATNETEAIGRLTLFHVVGGKKCEGHSRETGRQPLDKLQEMIKEHSDYVNYSIDAALKDSGIMGYTLDKDEQCVQIIAPSGAVNEDCRAVLMRQKEMTEFTKDCIMTTLGFKPNVPTHTHQKSVFKAEENRTKEAVENAREMVRQGNPKEAIRLVAETAIKTPGILDRMKKERPDLYAGIEEELGQTFESFKKEMEEKQKPIVSPINIDTVQPNLVKAIQEDELIKQYGIKRLNALAKKTGYHGVMINPKKRAYNKKSAISK